MLNVCNPSVNRENPAMGNPDRLSGLDSSFLHLERHGAHMHVGSVLVFEGEAPGYVEFVEALERRLHLVPRYRQKLAHPPLGQGRPVWIDDPHFNARYHVRHAALPAPANDEQLRRMAGRVFSSQLDRAQPLWELWLVDRVGEDRFAIISKTHHALVDGVSGVDIATVLFDLEPEPPEADPPPAWFPRPEPSGASLLAASVAERLSAPLDALRIAREAVARPERAAAEAGRAVSGLAAMAAAGLQGAPPSPINGPIGPHRRFAWVDADLQRFKAIKSALGGTVNDVVLTVVTGSLREHVLRRGRAPEGLELKAMVPVSVRADAERGALGNRVAAMYAPLPIHAADPLERFRIVHEAMGGLKDSGQAVGAEVITRLAGFAPPTVLDQAARLASRQRFFNLVVTNVPGPQFPLYLSGPQAARDLPAGAADAGQPARDRDHVLQRPARVRPARRLRRPAGRSTPSRTTSRAPSTSWPRPRACSRRPCAGAGGPRRAASLARGPRAPRASAQGGRRAPRGRHRGRRPGRPDVLPRVARERRGGRAIAGARRGAAGPRRTAPAGGGARAAREPHRPADQRRSSPAGHRARPGHAGPEPDPARARARQRDPLLRPGPPPDALQALQRDLTGPFDPGLAAAGQAVILAPREGAGGATAAAWRRLARDVTPQAARAFAEHWLGRGAAG